jgi:hypothetical protein
LLAVLAGASVALAGLGVAALTSPHEAGDRWATFIAAGDRVAGVVAGAPATGLSARVAYLLAFHEAQDAADVGRMLIAAQRLDRIGEPALADHVRRVARETSVEATTPR